MDNCPCHEHEQVLSWVNLFIVALKVVESAAVGYLAWNITGNSNLGVLAGGGWIILVGVMYLTSYHKMQHIRFLKIESLHKKPWTKLLIENFALLGLILVGFSLMYPGEMLVAAVLVAIIIVGAVQDFVEKLTGQKFIFKTPSN